MEFSVNVFTLNCWGIPAISKNLKERYQAIAKYLKESTHNIVCLQEVWSEKDYLFLKENTKDNLPYSHYFYSGVVGSGLCVFSKWVIQDVFFHQWPLNGYIHKIHHGDWFGGKGIGLCRIKYDNILINVYCTHLHAEYHVDDIYLAHRVLQAYATAEFVNITAAPADIVILAGDLNTAPGELAYKLITQLTSLQDPEESHSLDKTTETIWKSSGTSDCADNSYSNPKLVQSCPEGKRIDHILFKHSKSWKGYVAGFGNPLPSRVPGQQFSYSDHNAVALRLNMILINKSTERQASKNEALDETVQEAIKVCNDALNNLNKSRKLFLIVGGLTFMFLLSTVGFWSKSVLHDFVKLLISAISFYYILMGTLWNKIETNCVKCGLSALQNFAVTRELTINANRKTKDSSI